MAGTTEIDMGTLNHIFNLAKAEQEKEKISKEFSEKIIAAKADKVASKLGKHTNTYYVFEESGLGGGGVADSDTWEYTGIWTSSKEGIIVKKYQHSHDSEIEQIVLQVSTFKRFLGMYSTDIGLP